MMLSAGVHTGTRNSDSNMREYIWRRRNDGLHILNIGKTWEKLVLAARVIVAIENPEDVIAISARPYGMRATLKYGKKPVGTTLWNGFPSPVATSVVSIILFFLTDNNHR